MSDLFPCPHCGANVRANAKVCRECGSDQSTGWQSEEDISLQSVDIPDGYGPEDDPLTTKPKAWIPITALLVAAAFVAWLLRGLF